MKVDTHFTLSNGVRIPAIGFGTYQVQEGPETFEAVKAALAEGYRHIDTAQGYRNEEGVGRGVKASGLPREEVFITSKLTNSIRGYDNTVRAIEDSLKRLGTDYMDLFLLHWPVPVDFKDNWQQMNAESWLAMEEALQAGKIRALGISNFHKRHFEPLLKTAKVQPVVNQIRLCPGDKQETVVNDSRAQGMLLSAYSPLGQGKMSNVKELADIADETGKTVAQVALRWSLQRGYNPLPKSITPSRIKENLAVFDFELSADQMARINALDGVMGYSTNPDSISW